MTKGYVLIVVEPGREMEAYEGFMKVKEVRDVSPLLGDIDFILIMEVLTPEDFARIIIKKVRVIPGVVSTKTLIQDDFVKHFETLME